MRFWTDPYGRVPQRTLREIRFQGGHRHGGESSLEQRGYAIWWPKRVAEILRNG
jgi:hypothetical protein